MKVLFVCSFTRGEIAPFIRQQAENLRKTGWDIQYSLITEKGVLGYLKHLTKLKKNISDFRPDLVNAHYGLSGLLAVLQQKVPVIITFHGSDINNPKARLLSKIAICRSAWSVFVSDALAQKARVKRNYSVIPCGMDLKIFHPLDKSLARQQLGIHKEEILILFSNSFTNHVKNYPLARQAIQQINNSQLLSSPLKLLELTGYTLEEVNLLLNACNVALLTSFSEGSPNFIKEAMASNRPIVSTDVGDVKSLVKGIPGCFIAENNAKDVANKILQALQFEHSIGARQRIIDCELEIGETAKKIIQVYEHIIQNFTNEQL